MNIRGKLIFGCLFLFLFSTVNGEGQVRIRKTVTRIAKAIARQDTYDESVSFGFAGTESKQWERFEDLLKTASAPELLKLAGHDRHAIVRIYALKALKTKGVKIPSSLVAQFSEDHSRIQTRDGCIGGEQTASELAGVILESNN